jgi:hypothetical protein
MAVSIKIVRLSTVCSELKPGNEGNPPALPKMSRVLKLSVYSLLHRRLPHVLVTSPQFKPRNFKHLSPGI